MLTQTTETALQLLVYLSLRDGREPIPPSALAEYLGASPSYMAKITGNLVKAGILASTRGSHGGVSLAERPEDISLLAVVEACQGKILGDYCGGEAKPHQTCGFHQAMLEAHEALVSTLARWSVGDIAARPQPAPELRGKVDCKMGCVCRGIKQISA